MIEIFQGKKMVPPVKALMELPLMVPSFFSQVGVFDKTDSYFLTSKGKIETFFTVVLRYQIKQVDQ